MSYYNEDQLKKYFEKAIQRESTKRVEALKKEIDYAYQKEMAKVISDLDMKKKLELNKLMRDVHAEYQDRLNQIGAGYDEMLIKERSLMINHIFDKVYKKLHKYVTTEDYVKHMSKQLESVQSFIGMATIDVMISTKDESLKQAFSKVKGIRLVQTNEVEIGGFIAVSNEKNIRIDETLDAKLANQRDWFYQNAKLFIKQ